MSILVAPVRASMTRSGLDTLTPAGSDVANAGRSDAPWLSAAAASEDLFADLPAAAGFAACRGFSRTMAVGGLSARSPWNTEWRTLPVLVHSLNDTSAMSLGSTQCALRSMAVLAENGLLSVASASRFLRNCASDCALKPV